jgi:hypothetical protein
MTQSIHDHKWQNWRTLFMAVRSPLEKAVFMNMILSLISLKVIKIIDKYDNYPLLGMTYIVIDDILWPLQRILHTGKRIWIPHIIFVAAVISPKSWSGISYESALPYSRTDSCSKQIPGPPVSSLFEGKRCGGRCHALPGNNRGALRLFP